jgi:hypothetical protein
MNHLSPKKSSNFFSRDGINDILKKGVYTLSIATALTACWPTTPEKAAVQSQKKQEQIDKNQLEVRALKVEFNARLKEYNAFMNNEYARASTRYASALTEYNQVSDKTTTNAWLKEKTLDETINNMKVVNNFKKSEEKALDRLEKKIIKKEGKWRELRIDKTTFDEKHQVGKNGNSQPTLIQWAKKYFPFAL